MAIRITIESDSPGEGKSTIAVALVKKLLACGFKVQHKEEESVKRLYSGTDFDSISSSMHASTVKSDRHVTVISSVPSVKTKR